MAEPHSHPPDDPQGTPAGESQPLRLKSLGFSGTLVLGATTVSYNAQVVGEDIREVANVSSTLDNVISDTLAFIQHQMGDHPNADCLAKAFATPGFLDTAQQEKQAEEFLRSIDASKLPKA